MSGAAAPVRKVKNLELNPLVVELEDEKV